MSRTDELRKQLGRAEEREAIEANEGISKTKKRERMIALTKDFLEGRKEFMIKNAYVKGKTTIYPTSRACLRGIRIDPHVHKDLPEGSKCEDCP